MSSGTNALGHGRSLRRSWRPVCAAALVSTCMVAGCSGGLPDAANSPPADPAAPPPVARLSGTVEAVQARSVIVPRLQGPFAPLLIIGLVEAGTRVEPGDLLVEFDRQQQERDAFDRRAELVSLDADIEKKRAEQAAAEAKDQTELTAARHDVGRAELDVRRNELIPRIDAEKNTLALDQARARFAQLQTTFDLKRAAAEADLRILEIRRVRAARALGYAEANARLMVVRAPFGGLVVLKRNYRNGSFIEVANGDEVRPGTPIVDIVDTSRMRVRARVNQADAGLVEAGQRVKVGLDGFPDLVFDGVIEAVTPMASASRLSQTVRSFTALVAIDEAHPQLLPDLTAWVDIPATTPAAVASRSPR